MARINAGRSLCAMLDLVAWSEGTDTGDGQADDGYQRIVTGAAGPNLFTDYSAHPFAHGRRPIVVRPGPDPLLSTASGRYQINLATWRTISIPAKLGTFSPENQDCAGLQLFARAGAIDAIAAGDVEEAVTLLAGTWASFPGNHYGQGGKPLIALRQRWDMLLNSAPATEAEA